MKLLKLEERIVLDGAIGVEAISAAESLELAENIQIDNILDNPLLQHTDAEEGLNITLINSDITQLELLEKTFEDTFIIKMNTQQDLAEDIIQKIHQLSIDLEQPINNISIISHGGVGQFELGSATIDSKNVELFQHLEHRFSQDASIKLFGCNLVNGEGKGQDLLNALANLTGTDTYGSNDLTGADGDWILEASSKGAKLFSPEDQQDLSYALIDFKDNLLTSPIADAPEVWIRADSLSALSDGDAVTSWSDVNGGSFTASQVTPSKQPIFVESGIGGHNSVRFVRDDLFNGDALTFTELIDTSATSGFTSFVVIQPDLNAGNQIIYQSDTGGNFRLFLSADEVGHNYNTGSGTKGASTNDFDFTTGVGYVTIANADNGNNFLIGLGGQEQVDAITDNYTLNGSTTGDIGSKSGVVGLDGLFAEMLIFEQSLDAIEQARVENYLADRYNIAGEKYAYDTNDGGNQLTSEITGIAQHEGRTAIDSATSDFVTIDNPTDLDDFEYFLFSHDGADNTTWTTTDTASDPDNNTYRIAREWRVDNTGDVGSVDISFDVSGLGAAPAGYNQYFLMIDKDGDFHNNTSEADEMTTHYQLTDQGGGIWATTIDVSEALQDGYHFALGVMTDTLPELSGISTGVPINYTEGDGVISLNTATLSDNSANFDTGSITLDIIKNNDSGDKINIESSGNITLDGTTVEHGGTAIGSITSDGDGSNPFTITFNSNATTTEVDDVLANLTYENDSDDPTGGEKVIRYVFRDGDGGVSSEENVLINMTPVNDDAVLTNNSTTTAVIGTTVTITNTELLVSDEDNSVTDLVFTLSDLPDNGTLYINGVAANLTTNRTFTQDDINNNLITYTHDGSATSSDSIDFTFTDGAGFTSGTVTHNFNITPPNTIPSLTTNSIDEVNQGSSITITTAMLEATDPEEDPSDITYTLDSVPSNGNLYLSGAPSTPLGIGDTFTQQQIDDGELSFTPNGGNSNISDSFQVDISDGIGSLDNQTINLSINQAPSNDTNSSLDVQKGSSSNTITSALLDSSDPDDGASVLTYRITSLPSNGSIVLSGTGTLALNSTFTQDDVDTGKVSYTHDDTLTTSDSVTLELTDSGGFAVSNIVFAININSNPAITLTALDVEKGDASTTITDSHLDASDNEQSAANITYTLDTVPTHGELYNNGILLGVSDSFTQDDVDNNLITYKHLDGTNTSDTFQFDLSDGSGGSLDNQSLTININQPPTLSNNTGTSLDEGSTKIITNTMLEYSDPNSDTLTYTLVDTPDNGDLYLNNTLLNLGDTFTQADVNSNLLEYRHDGSETTSDTFDFDLSDGNFGASNQTFNLTINAQDDAPVLTNNNLSLNEGATKIFSTSELSVSDPDTSNSDLIYTLTDTADHGFLTLDGTTPLGVGDTFTQQNIIDGDLEFVHDGSDTTSDQFSFTLKDATTTSATLNHNIDITPVDDAPSLTTNNNLSLNEGVTKSFSNSELDITDPDTNANDLDYTLTELPDHGFLTLDGTTPLTLGATFTQDHIDNGDLEYVHDGSETTSDEFSFTISDDTTTSTTLTHNIDITAVDDAPTLSNNNLSLDEGATKTFTTSELNATDPDTLNSSLTYTLTDLPDHGFLTLDGVTPLMVGGSFTQQNIIDGDLEYVHDGNESTSDSFDFDLSDGNTTLATATHQIDISPVNDTPTLNTQNVNVSENATSITIDSSMLNADDVEDSDSDLIFTLTSLPTAGTLYINGQAADLSTLSSFTQAQVDNNEITFDPEDTEETALSFSFSVTDTDGGVLNSQTLNINVSPVDDVPELTQNALTLDEGAQLNFTTSQLSIHDPDTSTSDLTYTLQSTPSNGTLQIGTTILSIGDQFTKDDIVNGNLAYSHDGSESSSDSFTFTLQDATTVSTTLTQSIVINPVNDDSVLSNLGFNLDEGSTHTITSAELNLSDSDNTAQELTYQLTQSNLPSHGQLTLNGTVLSYGDSFTQQDINNGNVKFQHDGSETTSDSFDLIAKDPTGTAHTTTVQINITPVGDAPQATPTSATSINPGPDSTITLVPENFGISDVDSSSTDLTIQLINISEGQLNQTQFTLQDLIDGNIELSAGSTLDDIQLEFSINDETNNSINLNFIVSKNQPPTFNPTTLPEIDAGTTVTLKDTDFGITDSDTTDSNDLVITLDHISQGLLLLDGQEMQINESFNLKDLEDGKVEYEASGSENQVNFSFTAQDHTGNRVSRDFEFDINVIIDTLESEAPFSEAVFEIDAITEKIIDYNQLANNFAVASVIGDISGTINSTTSSFNLDSSPLAGNDATAAGVTNPNQVFAQINQLLADQPTASGSKTNSPDSNLQGADGLNNELGLNRFANAVDYDLSFQQATHKDIAESFNGIGFGLVDDELDKFQRFANTLKEDSQVNIARSQDLASSLNLLLEKANLEEAQTESKESEDLPPNS